MISKMLVKMSLGMEPRFLQEGTPAKQPEAQGSRSSGLLVQSAMNPHGDCLSPTLKDVTRLFSLTAVNMPSSDGWNHISGLIASL